MSKPENKTDGSISNPNRKVGLAKKTMRKLNEGELSQVAGGLMTSGGGCAKCSSFSGNWTVNCPNSIY